MLLYAILYYFFHIFDLRLLRRLRINASQQQTHYEARDSLMKTMKPVRVFYCVCLLPALSLFSGLSIAEEKPYMQTRALAPAMANKAVSVAAAECAKSGFQVAVALVDRAGILQDFTRNPHAGSHTVDVAIAKAKTSASFKTSTIDLMTNQRLKHLVHAPGVLLLGGGVPITIGGHFYGGIGVSGAPAEKTSGDTDDRCARAGIDAVREELEFAE